jgi:hypothetical protein
MKKNPQNKQLRSIAKKRGFNVRSGKDFSILFFGATINVDNNAGPRVWGWRMLHELGHAELIVRKETCHINTMLRLLKIHDGSYKPTEAFYRDYLNMEWKAWEQGMKIAKREGIRINEGQYWRHAKKCHGTYVKHLRSHF